MNRVSPWTPVDVLDRDPAGRPLTVRLLNGRRAEFQRREDDCMRAAVATLTQLPLAEIPDPSYDEDLAAGVPHSIIVSQALADLATWASERGLRLRYHYPPPVERHAWIGIDARGADAGNGHVVVMSHSEFVHDPASNWPCPPGHVLDHDYQIHYGITFAPKEPA